METHSFVRGGFREGALGAEAPPLQNFKGRRLLEAVAQA